MSTIKFHKYQGTGNDFVIIDNRKLIFPHNQQLIRRLCNRRFGIGADGLMLLQNKEDYDFEMVYFNADGKTSSMCGNGGRCITAFAQRLGIVGEEAFFLAIDGPHKAKISNNLVSLKMNNVSEVEQSGRHCFLDTGSPHYVSFVDDLQILDVDVEGRKIRFNERFAKEGTNVNFVEHSHNQIKARTYERGVEAETLSCGTGVTAVALCAKLKGLSTSSSHCDISTPGGPLTIYFKHHPDHSFTDIWLEGAADFVFEGEVIIN